MTQITDPLGDFATPLVRHVDGVPWFEAKVPPFFHRCKAQTFGLLGLRSVQRCACGAIKTGAWWHERNARRRWW